MIPIEKDRFTTEKVEKILYMMVQKKQGKFWFHDYYGVVLQRKN